MTSAGTVAALVVAACWLTGATGSDRRGTAAIEAALRELGGAERIAGHDRWLAVGTGRENSSAELQGLAPDVATWREHAERIAIRRDLAAAAWERRTPRNDSSLRWRRFVYGDRWTGVVDWVGQLARRREGGASREQRARLARRVPHLLLLEALSGDPRWLGERRLGSRTADLVAVRLGGGPTLTLVIERDPARLVGVDYPLDLAGRGEVIVAWSWPQWRADSALVWTPTGHRVAIDSRPFQEVEYTRFQIGAPAADSLLGVEVAFPSSSSLHDAPPPPADLPARGEVAPGVHLLEAGSFRVMVVDLGEFVVLAEAPEAHPGLEGIPAIGAGPPAAVGPLVRAAVERIAGGKPVGFVAISHHHSDHLGGLAAVVDSGTTILVPPGDVEAARAALAGAGHRGSRLTIEPVPDRRIITAGNRTVEVLAVGPNPHTDANLLVWLPVERIAFQGDLFYYDGGGPFPPSGRERMNRFFATWLARRGIAPRAVYGVHSDAAGPEALARARERTSQ